LLSSPEYNDAHVISLLARAHAFSTAALNEAKRLGDEELVSQTYSFLGCSVKRSSPISLEAYNEAERCLQKSLDIELKKHGERHLHVMKVYESLGEIYEGRERYRTNDPIAVDNQISLSETRSEVFFQKALYSAETANGPNSKAAHLILAFHPFHFTDIRSHSGNPFFYDWNNFYCWYIDRAVFYEDKSKPVADRYYRAAIEEMKDFCGEFHPYTAIALNAFACFLRGEHLDEEASDYEHQADIIWDRERKHPTKFHRIILPTEQGIGPKKYLFLGDISKARKEWQKSYTAGPALADALLGYSRYLKQQNKLSQSLQLEKEASKILTEYKLMSTLLSRERIMRKQDWI
jgi:tetratricopeptide (TPR) repeat protein